MQKRFQKIEHLLTSLPVFEAAARHGSFTRAAEELRLTQPTVSHHIQNMEMLLQTELFQRRHNRIALTEAGQQLSEAISLGLGHIDRAAREISVHRAENALTLACSFGFAHGWLMPRFSGLRQALGHFPVDLVTTDWLKGFDRDSADILIVWAGAGPSTRPRMPLFPEDVTPVCGRIFADQHPEIADACDNPSMLLDYDLVHFNERDSEFMNWEKWLASQGVPYSMPPACYRFSNFEFMLRAIVDGEGIGLGWTQLIEDQLAGGELVRVGPTVRNHAAAYSVEYKRGVVPDEVLDRALAWFQDEANAA